MSSVSLPPALDVSSSGGSSAISSPVSLNSSNPFQITVNTQSSNQPSIISPLSAHSLPFRFSPTHSSSGVAKLRPPGSATSLSATKRLHFDEKSHSQSHSVSPSASIFKSSRAKKIFQQFDTDHDKYLSKAEFEAGIKKIAATAQNVNLSAGDAAVPVDFTPESIDALWQQCDLNADGKISQAEFNYRFAGGPNPLNEGKKAQLKPSLSLQSPKPVKNHSNKLSVQDMKLALESLWDGGKRRFKSIELPKSKLFDFNELRKLLNSILVAEKAAAAAEKRELADWAQIISKEGSYQTHHVEKFFSAMETSKTAKVDLTLLFENAKLKPSQFPAGLASPNGKRKKKGGDGHGPSYMMTTIKPENVRDFVSDQLLKAIEAKENSMALSAQLSGLGVGNRPPLKCHPPLKHWGDNERKSRGLMDSGYKTTIFLSERTKIKAIVKIGASTPHQAAHDSQSSIDEFKALESLHIGSNGHSGPSSAGPTSPTAQSLLFGADPSAPAAVAPPGSVRIYCVFRTEYTAMARYETLYHAVLTFNADEVLQAVEFFEKKVWCDGEVERIQNISQWIPDWSQRVGPEEELEELSIPPIV